MKQLQTYTNTAVPKRASTFLHKLLRVPGSASGSAGILLTVFIAAPLLWVAGYSLLYSFGFIGIAPQGPTVRHWQAVLEDQSTLSSLILTLGVASVSTSVTACIAIGIATLSPNVLRQRLTLIFLCIALGTPAVVVGFWTFLLFAGGGLFSRVAFWFGAINGPDEFPVIVSDRWAIGIALAEVAYSLPLLLLFLSRSLESMKTQRMIALATSFGATRWQIRWMILLPSLLGRCRALLILIFLFNLGSYEIPVLLGRQSPQMLSVLTQRRSGVVDIDRRPELFVVASIYFALTSCILLLYLRWRSSRD